MQEIPSVHDSVQYNDFLGFHEIVSSKLQIVDPSGGYRSGQAEPLQSVQVGIVKFVRVPKLACSGCTSAMNPSVQTFSGDGLTTSMTRG